MEQESKVKKVHKLVKNKRNYALALLDNENTS